MVFKVIRLLLIFTITGAAAAGNRQRDDVVADSTLNARREACHPRGAQHRKGRGAEH
jgi:hypothetical protein